MGIGFGEIAILALFVFAACVAPGVCVAWNRYGRLFVGGLSLIVLFASALAELASRGYKTVRPSTS